MAKKTFAPPEFRTPFPDHALTEMEADPAQVQFWSTWAAVGDAELEVNALAVDIVRTDQEWRDCRSRAGMTGQLGIECGCGQHMKRIQELLRLRSQARAVVDKRIAAFKRGH